MSFMLCATVLPKFEVKILAPSYIVKDSRADIPITLEAKWVDDL